MGGYAFLVILAAALASLLVVRYLSSSTSCLRLLDQPNERSLHARPIPRSGGLGVVSALALAWGGAGFAYPAVVIPALALSLLSLIDDARGLPVHLRFAAHLAASIVLVASAGLPSWAWVPGVLALAWFTNLYNFMDGSDGLAGGMAVFGFGAYGVAAWLGGAQDLALLCASLAAGALSFLCFNYPPARIFMGDVGAIPLGFLAGGIGLAGWQAHVWPVWFPLLVFSPFVLDATVTLAKRGLRGEKIWAAHREHYYQRMVLMGLGHPGVALRWYAAMALAAAGAVWLRELPGHTVAMVAAAWYLAMGFYGWRVDRRWRQFRGTGRP